MLVLGVRAKVRVRVMVRVKVRVRVVCERGRHHSLGGFSYSEN